MSTFPTIFSREIEFKLKFGCYPPNTIDQGVRLEIRSNDTSSIMTNNWLPIRYYTPSLVEPINYDSFVHLDSSQDSVTAQSVRYNSSLPLLFVNSSKAITIREYICGKLLQSVSEDIYLELRWMQRFGRRSEINDATWILDDIKIRMWNGVCFIQVLNEDFSRTQEIISGSYTLKGAEVKIPSCESSVIGSALNFEESMDEMITRRSIITHNMVDITDSCEEGKLTNSKLMVIFLVLLMLQCYFS